MSLQAAVDSSSANSTRIAPSTTRRLPPTPSPAPSTRQTPAPPNDASAKPYIGGPSRSPSTEVSGRSRLLQEAASSLGGMQRARGEELDTREAELMASERHADQVIN